MAAAARRASAPGPPVSRRRRRRADPARLPRRDSGVGSRRPEAAESGLRREDRERAELELARVDDALGRATAVLAAALVYFGAWAANAVLGLFPPPSGVDLTHPQFLIGAGALVASLFLARYLVRSFPTRRLVAVARWASAGFGAVVLLFVSLSVVAGPATETFVFIAAGMGFAWFVGTLWVALLGRRAGRLLELVGTPE